MTFPKAAPGNTLDVKRATRRGKSDQEERSGCRGRIHCVGSFRLREQFDINGQLVESESVWTQRSGGYDARHVPRYDAGHHHGHDARHHHEHRGAGLLQPRRRLGVLLKPWCNPYCRSSDNGNVSIEPTRPLLRTFLGGSLIDRERQTWLAD